MSCNTSNPPQQGQNYTFTIGKTTPNGSFRFSLETYFKRLFHLVDYDGTVYDFINTDYFLDNQLLHGYGKNYGINLLIAKQKGKLTGWISYNIGRAFRNFDEKGTSGQYPANHERIHEINMVLSYAIGKQWDFGVTSVFTSGTPFTPAEQFYLFSGNIVTQFGEYNAYRLKNYFRTDLSVNYKFHRRNMKESGINFSLYNISGRKNELFYAWKILRTGEFKYRPISFVLRIMPSISYYFKF